MAVGWIKSWVIEGHIDRIPFPLQFKYTFFEQHLHNSVVGHTHTASRQTGGIKLMGQERNNCSSRRRHCACRSWPTKNSKAATRKILCLFSISPKNYIWIWTRSSKLGLCAPLTFLAKHYSIAKRRTFSQ